MSRRVSCIPSTDTAFSDVAATALARIDGKLNPERVGPALAELLRSAYPKVEIHRQTELARVFDDDVWYAYRDGKPFGAIDPPA